MISCVFSSVARTCVPPRQLFASEPGRVSAGPLDRPHVLAAAFAVAEIADSFDQGLWAFVVHNLTPNQVFRSRLGPLTIDKAGHFVHAINTPPEGIATAFVFDIPASAGAMQGDHSTSSGQFGGGEFASRAFLAIDGVDDCDNPVAQFVCRVARERLARKIMLLHRVASRCCETAIDTVTVADDFGECPSFDANGHISIMGDSFDCPLLDLGDGPRANNRIISVCCRVLFHLDRRTSLVAGIAFFALDEPTETSCVSVRATVSVSVEIPLTSFAEFAASLAIFGPHVPASIGCEAHEYPLL